MSRKRHGLGALNDSYVCRVLKTNTQMPSFLKELGVGLQ